MKKFERSWHKTQKIWKKTRNQTLLSFFVKGNNFKSIWFQKFQLYNPILTPWQIQMRNQILPWIFCKSYSISSIPIEVPQQFRYDLFSFLFDLFCSVKTIFFKSLAFSVPFSSLCCSKTCINAFFVKITEVLPTLFSAKTLELTELFKTSPIRQTTKLKTLKVYPLFSKKQIIKKAWHYSKKRYINHLCNSAKI